MLRQGFGTTSIEDICIAAGITKGGFFHYFKNKEDLGKAVTRHYWRNMQTVWDDAPFRKHADPLARVLKFIDYSVSASKGPGLEQRCLLGNFAQELSDTHPGIRSENSACFAEWSEYLKMDLDAAKKKYLSKKALDTKGLADYVIATMEGSLLLAKAHQDKNVYIKNLKHLTRYVESIFKKKRP